VVVAVYEARQASKISDGRKMWRQMQPSQPNSRSSAESKVARYIEYIEDPQAIVTTGQLPNTCADF
jgi:hypothetical protein